ncbi:MAG: hypothetical protein PHV02_12100 [Rhodocyclaceae bacterium]|nr:hypothetical protein [Rhodocyclaceae bacterium]
MTKAIDNKVAEMGKEAMQQINEATVAFRSFGAIFESIGILALSNPAAAHDLATAGVCWAESMEAQLNSFLHDEVTI